MRTPEQIDELIAEKVMGLIPCNEWTPINLGSAGGPALLKNCHHTNCYPTVRNADVGGCPKYSTNIKSAWEVINRFRQGFDEHAAAVIEMAIYDSFAPDCRCLIFGPTINDVSAMADEMPMAICLAALKAVGVEV